MPSVHKRARSPYWFASYFLPDGRRTFRSTKQRNKTKALEICLGWAKTSTIARDGRLTAAAAQRAVAQIYEIVNGDSLCTASVEEYLQRWLAEGRDTWADSTNEQYALAVKRFCTYLGPKAKQPLDLITRADCTGFRQSMVNKAKAASINKAVKALKGAFKCAQRDSLCRDNPFTFVDNVKGLAHQRRPFTLPEIKRVLDVCNDEWRGMTLAGLYTGQRLSDIAELTWANIDLAARNITFRTRKTGRTVSIPMAEPLYAWFMAQSSPHEPAAPVFPSLYPLDSATRSGQFLRVLVDAGLAIKKAHRKLGNGRGAAREFNDLSFHCLRHTATTLLKQAGVSDAIARDIIGHESVEISRIYTHISESTKLDAVRQLPDVTK